MADATGRPRLCVVTTGGTIAMARDHAGTARPPSDPIDPFAAVPDVRDKFDLEVVPLFNLDSVNLTPSHWTALAEAVYARRDAGFDGFVVVHGTDTMAYSAAALALALGPGPLPWPVVFTGAQRTADDEAPDGPTNLRDACEVAAGDFGEVLVVFGGEILRGCRAVKRSAVALDGFEMPGAEPLGGLLAGGMWTGMNAVGRRREKEWTGDSFFAGFAEGVATLRVTPGVEPGWFRGLLEGDGRASGLVLETLGAGNVPESAGEAQGKLPGAGEGWVGLIRQATERGVPVVLTGSFAGDAPEGGTGEGGYASGRAALAAGGIAAVGLTAACADVKLRWALAKAQAAGEEGEDVITRVRETMDRVWVGEALT